MKIGIVASGFEMLPLMNILNQYEHEVHFFVDWKCWPWGDKSSDLVDQRLDEVMTYFDDKVDLLIVPPIVEAKMKAKANEKKLKARIIPLFETYLMEYAFKYSLVGKLGVLLESDGQKEIAKQLIKEFSATYTLQDNQKAIKKFHKDFPLWSTSVRMRNYFLTTYGRREPMVRKTLKHDLVYFADARVDTLIPMSRGFLFYQKIIRQRLNRKKKRFHGLDAVQACFEKLVTADGDGYSITLHCTDIPQTLLDQKKWMKVLSRGGDVEVKVVEVG